MGRLSTHVLDTAHGKPAAGLTIDLYYLGGESRQHSSPQHIASFTTNADGRTDAPLLAAEEMVTGVFELVFHVGEYFGLEPRFLNQVPVRFRITYATQNYHFPLLVSPDAYSTYRGS
ncbi:hydroxyisourate hydrolase [soil metagenome]